MLEIERERKRRNINRGWSIFIIFLSLVPQVHVMEKMEAFCTNKYSFIFNSDRNNTLHHILYVFSLHSLPSCLSHSLFLNRFLRQSSYQLVSVSWASYEVCAKQCNTQPQPLHCNTISALSQLEFEK
jgi:hypothetical protein